jgi:DNA repair exonuclease SbcCD ATPase subunit
MIKFGKLMVEGFCSIAYYETILSSNGITIIRGRNGAGKTTLLSSINWVLYGQLPKETKTVNTWKKYQSKDYKGTKVTLYWEAKGKIHQVIRCSNYTDQVNGAKGGDRLLYLIDNEHISERKKLDIQKRIEEDLGMSHNLFRNSIMFGQGLKRLAQESASDKKDLFEEIFDVAYITKAKALAKAEYDSLNKELKRLESECDNLSYDVESYKSTYEELKGRGEREAKAHKEKLTQLKSKVRETQDKLAKIEFDENRLAKAIEKKADLSSKLNQLEEEFNLKNKSIASIKTTEGLSQFIDDIIMIVDKPSLVKKKLLKLKEGIAFINNYKDQEKAVSKKLSEVKDVIWELKTLESKATSLKAALKGLKEDIKGLRESKQQVNQDNSSSRYLKKYNEALEELKNKRIEAETLGNKVDNYQWLIQEPLGNKGLKSYIIESSLSTLNNILAHYSQHMGFSIEFGIDLSTTKKDFYTLIEIDNNIVEYSELSGGQKQLVHIAMAFAMHEMTTKAKHINVLFLDEVFEHLDNENIEIITSLIRKVSNDNRSVYIITHQESLPLSNAHTIKLDYHKGLTVFP